MDTGFNASPGHPIGASVIKGAKSAFCEDDPSKMAKHMQQYELPVAWTETDKCNLSINKSMLSRSRKYIAKQIRFDTKPLGEGMCYCCGSILWSRVNNCHTNLVDIDIDDKSIPAIANQKVLYQNNGKMLQYRHKVISYMPAVFVSHLNH